MTDPRSNEVAFSDIDVEILQLVDQVLRLGLIEKDVALQMARVIGSSVSRIASAQIDAIEARVDEPLLEDGTEPAVLARVPAPVHAAHPRVHVAASHARRRTATDGARGGSSGESQLTVGFADLVGFTALSQQIDAHELAAVVDRFESTAYDIVGAARGQGRQDDRRRSDVRGRDAADVGVETALSLAEAYHDDESLSDVRVGLAIGPCSSGKATCSGRPSTSPVASSRSRTPVRSWCQARFTTRSEDNAGLRWKSLRTRYLKDIGRVQLWAVRREGDEFDREGPFERARRRRSTIRDMVADMIDRRSEPAEDSVAEGGNGRQPE